jgi:hypothetical protein
MNTHETLPRAAVIAEKTVLLSDENPLEIFKFFPTATYCKAFIVLLPRIPSITV